MAGGDKGVNAMTRLRRKLGLLLPRGPKARELGLEFQGELPDGWTPISERRKAKNTRKRTSKKNVNTTAQARGAPPPGPQPKPADEPLSAADALEHSPSNPHHYQAPGSRKRLPATGR